MKEESVNLLIDSFCMQLQQEHTKIDGDGLKLIEMSSSEVAFLISYLSGIKKNNIYFKLFTIFKAEMPLFLAMFSGTLVKIPKLSFLVEALNYIKIYTYVEKNKFSLIAYKEAATLFKKRSNDIKAIVERVKIGIDSARKVYES